MIESNVKVMVIVAVGAVMFGFLGIRSMTQSVFLSAIQEMDRNGTYRSVFLCTRNKV